MTATVARESKATLRQAYDAVKFLGAWMPRAELKVCGLACKGEEGQFFKDKLCEMQRLIQGMPKTYEQEGKGNEAIVTLHYFTAGADWWITEKDIEAEQHQAYGIADIGYGPEAGYISIVELLENEAELDLHFAPRTLGELKAEWAEKEAALRDEQGRQSQEWDNARERRIADEVEALAAGEARFQAEAEDMAAEVVACPNCNPCNPAGQPVFCAKHDAAMWDLLKAGVVFE